jgi:hypothetical protein
MYAEYLLWLLSFLIYGVLGVLTIDSSMVLESPGYV